MFASSLWLTLSFLIAIETIYDLSHILLISIPQGIDCRVLWLGLGNHWCFTEFSLVVTDSTGQSEPWIVTAEEFG